MTDQDLSALVAASLAAFSDPDYVPPPPWEGPPVTPVPEAYTQLLAEFPTSLPSTAAALRELVELHAPKPYHVQPDGTVSHWQCEGCEVSGYEWEYPDWPCETSKVIGRHLGVEVTG